MSQETTPAIKWGVGPIAWANDDIRDWAPVTDPDVIMAEAAAAGFGGIEMSYVFPRHPPTLKQSLEKHGLVLCGAYRWSSLAGPGCFDREVEACCIHVDFCRAAGAKYALLAEGTGSLHWDFRGPRTEVKSLDTSSWRRLFAGLRRVAEHAEGRGIHLCLHPHAGTAIERYPEIERLLDGTGPEIGLCLDTGHLAYAGVDPTAVLRRWPERVEYLHLKDIRPEVLDRLRREKPTFLEAVQWNVFCTPGSGGVVDFAPLVAQLLTTGYQGWWVVEAEQDNRKYVPAEVSVQGRGHLDALARRIATTT